MPERHRLWLSGGLRKRRIHTCRQNTITPWPVVITLVAQLHRILRLGRRIMVVTACNTRARSHMLWVCHVNTPNHVQVKTCGCLHIHTLKFETLMARGNKMQCHITWSMVYSVKAFILYGVKAFILAPSQRWRCSMNGKQQQIWTKYTHYAVSPFSFVDRAAIVVSETHSRDDWLNNTTNLMGYDQRVRPVHRKVSQVR